MEILIHAPQFLGILRFSLFEFNVYFCTILANWTWGKQTQGLKTANEIQCANISYITNQKGYTNNTKLHEQRKLET